MPFARESFPVVPLPGTAYPPNENGWGLWWHREIREVRPSLEPVFDTYVAAYRRAEEQSRGFKQWAREFETQTGEERFLAGYEPFEVLATIDAARGTIDALSLSLLLAFDNLLTDVRIRLRGEQNAYCTNDGPELRNGVTVDRALDAVGNYLRHENEWRLHDYRTTYPSGQQLRSIWAIARLSTSEPIGADDGEGAYAQYTLTRPGPMILDMLADYERKGAEASYEDAESKVREAGMCTVRASFERMRAARASAEQSNGHG
jgi:hypothetical protein